MYRLQIYFKNRWKWGIKDYESIDAAEARVAELAKTGIKARVKNSSELFN